MKGRAGDDGSASRGRRNRRRTILLLSLGLLLLHPVPGFAANQTEEKVLGEPRSDRALVYFIRSPGWGKGRDTLLTLYADGTFLGVVKKNSYTFAHVDPGARLLWNGTAAREERFADLTSTREMTLEAGQEYYLVLSYLAPPDVLFSRVSSHEGSSLVQQVRHYVTPTPREAAAAAAEAEERFSWLEALVQRTAGPLTRVWRVPDSERERLLCELKKVFVGEIKVSATGEVWGVAGADDFQQSLSKRLGREGFEIVSAPEDSDAVITGTVRKVKRRMPSGSYKHVKIARVSLQTLEGQEIWSTEVDTERSSFRTNPFNVWSQLARRTAERLAASCAEREP